MAIYPLPFGHLEWRDPADDSRQLAPARRRADTTTTRVAIRIPATLKARIEASAELEGVAPSAWITRALARSVDPRVSTP